mgnify:CR=1 FL=1
MPNQKILYVTTEMFPYQEDSNMAMMVNKMALKMHQEGNDVRVFMPRFGFISERKFQLHEVIRLSGMNIIINDLDQPLIIKVASLPGERLQVYFIDNDEYFKRKATFTDEEGVLYPDNDERAIFFAKGVVETVKKLNWVPDVIHVHGWMASLLPVYLKQYYKNEGIFTDTKIVTSVYNSGFEGTIDLELKSKMQFDNIEATSLQVIESPSYENLMKLTIDHSDAIIMGSDNLSTTLTKYIQSSGKPFLPFEPKETAKEVYTNFLRTKVI